MTDTGIRRRTRGSALALVVAGIATALFAGTAAAPAAAATCTVTSASWSDLKDAFDGAPTSGAVICLGADIVAPYLVGGTEVDTLDVPAGSTVTLDLNGHALTIESPPLAGGGAVAPISVATGETLIIDATGGGSLTVLAPYNSAAIGGSGNTPDSGTIIINGGDITATSVWDGAAIGSAQFGSAGDITINGGNIRATTLSQGPGIGSGAYGASGNITINGGTIYAEGSLGSAGIGGGSDSGGNISITGGTVVAVGGSFGGSGIGGAMSNGGANVSLSGGDITATGAGGSGIGSGAGSSSAGTLTIYAVGTPTSGSGTAPNAASPTATIAPGVPGMLFTQTTQNETASAPASTRIVFRYVEPPVITTLTLPDGIVSDAYSTPVAATGGAPITFAVTAGALPDGLVLDPATGVVTGVPTVAGTFSFTVTATNEGGTDTQDYSVVVRERPVITTPSLSNGVRDDAYSQTVTATGTGPITFSVSAGSLPDGLVLDPETGVISGTPTEYGSFSFTITASNSVGEDTQDYTIVIPEPVDPIDPVDPVDPVVPTIPEAGGHLAITGGDTPTLWLIGGAALILAGAGAVFVSLRRRS